LWAQEINMAARFSFSAIPDVGYDSVGKLKLVKGTLTISETPTAGGDAPAASLFNLNTIYDIQFSGVAAVANGATGVPLRFVRSSGKVLGYTSNGAAAASLAEKTDAYSDTHTVEVTVWGT
jgi:hypothetical protein